MRLLIIEDDWSVARGLQEELQDEGFVVDRAATAQQGLDMARAHQYSAIILDLRLPDINGFEVCRRLRSEGNDTPILMLTGLHATRQKVAGLDCGADDYLVKPYEPEELQARLRSLLRRHSGRREAQLRVGDLVLDPARHEASRSGIPLSLSSREFEVLELLMRNPDTIVSREDILSQVWGIDYNPHTNVVDVYIRHLRRKIDPSCGDRIIHTIRGFGYRLSATAPELLTEDTIPEPDPSCIPLPTPPPEGEGE